MSLNEPSVDFHLKMQSASFRVPFEAVKKNSKNARKLDEKQFKKVQELVNDLKKPLDKKTKLLKMKQLITSMKVYEKKMKLNIKTEDELLSRIQARIVKLNELRDIQKDISDAESHAGTGTTLDNDFNRERLLNWYRNQTNLLISDYLLKNNHLIDNNPGLLFLKNMKCEKLIDSDIILASNEISTKILSGDLSGLVQWIDDNKSYLTRVRSDLEFQTRFQEYIEYVKKNENNKALEIFGVYLTPFTRTNFDEIQLASGLLTFIKKVQDDPENQNFTKYNELLSDSRYKYLSDYFLEIYYMMNGLSKDDPLLIYLSMGISSLKTRSCLCNTKHLTTDFGSILNEKLNVGSKELNKSSKLCPICSSEFNLLSQQLPYSHNVKSFLFDNPVMLPNGNIYDREKLIHFSTNSKVGEEEIKDPITNTLFGIDELVTMYPT